MMVSEKELAAELVKHRSASYVASTQQELPGGMGWAWVCACGHVLFGQNQHMETVMTAGASYVECALADHQSSAISALINAAADGYSVQECEQLTSLIWGVETKDFGKHSKQDCRTLATHLLGVGYRVVENPEEPTAVDYKQLTDTIWHFEADGFNYTGYSTRDAETVARSLLVAGVRLVADAKHTQN